MGSEGKEKHTGQRGAAQPRQSVKREWRTDGFDEDRLQANNLGHLDAVEVALDLGDAAAGRNGRKEDDHDARNAHEQDVRAQPHDEAGVEAILHNAPALSVCV